MKASQTQGLDSQHPQDENNYQSLIPFLAQALPGVFVEPLNANREGGFIRKYLDVMQLCHLECDRGSGFIKPLV